MQRSILAMAGAIMLALGSTAEAAVPELTISHRPANEVITVSARICDCEWWVLQGAECAGGPWTDLATMRNEPYQILTEEAPRFLRLWSRNEAGPAIAVFPDYVPRLNIKCSSTSRQVLTVCARICDCEWWVLQSADCAEGPWTDLATLRDEPYQILVCDAPKFLRLWSPDRVGRAVPVFPRRPRLEIRYEDGKLCVLPVCPLAPWDKWLLEESRDLKNWLVIDREFDWNGWCTELRCERPDRRFYRLVRCD